MTAIPAPRRATSRSYHSKGDPTWEPSVKGLPVSWWRRYFASLDMEDLTTWHVAPGVNDSSLQRAFQLVYGECDPKMYLHLGRRQLDGARIFRIDGHPRFGKHMRESKFYDWQSGPNSGKGKRK